MILVSLECRGGFADEGEDVRDVEVSVDANDEQVDTAVFVDGGDENPVDTGADSDSDDVDIDIDTGDDEEVELMDVVDVVASAAVDEDDDAELVDIAFFSTPAVAVMLGLSKVNFRYDGLLQQSSAEQQQLFEFAPQRITHSPPPTLSVDIVIERLVSKDSVVNRVEITSSYQQYMIGT